MVSILGNGAFTPLNYFFVALAVAAFVVEAWAFIDAIIRPAQAFTAAGKQTKVLWLIILGVAFVLGLYCRRLRRRHRDPVGGSLSWRPRSTWRTCGLR